MHPDGEFQAAQREFLRMVEELGRTFGGMGSRMSACSRCGRSEAEVGALVGGLRASTCDQFVEEARRLIEGKTPERPRWRP